MVQRRDASIAQLQDTLLKRQRENAIFADHIQEQWQQQQQRLQQKAPVSPEKHMVQTSIYDLKPLSFNKADILQAAAEIQATWFSLMRNQ